MGLLAEKLNNLDKIDKIIIATVFIVAAILSPVFADTDEMEEVTISIAQNVSFNADTDVFITSTNQTGYFSIEPGYKYIIKHTSGTQSRYLGVSGDVPEVGNPVTFIHLLTPGETFEFSSSIYGGLYFDYTSRVGVEVYRQPLNGMDDSIFNLTQFVSTDNIWETFNFAIPYILVIVLAVFGLYIIKRLIIGLSKGKGRI